jgi:ribosomal protein S18 acetylase RimI-like enzyme
VARERKYLAFLEAPPPAEVRKFVLGNIAERVPQFVAIDDGRVVGWCDVMPKPRPTLRHSGVFGIGVIDAYRGRGIGHALMDATVHAAWERGLTRIELTVRVDNERAKRLYEAFGFVVEGLCRHHILVEGKYHDSYLMALLHG